MKKGKLKDREKVIWVFACVVLGFTLAVSHYVYCRSYEIQLSEAAIVSGDISAAEMQTAASAEAFTGTEPCVQTAVVLAPASGGTYEDTDNSLRDVFGNAEAGRIVCISAPPPDSESLGLSVAFVLAFGFIGFFLAVPAGTGTKLGKGYCEDKRVQDIRK